MEQLKKLLEKKMQKPGSMMDESKKEAKIKALMGLKDSMGAMGGESLKNHLGEMQKVMVASSDKEGLEHGLDKAKDIVSKMPGNEEEAHEALESPAMEMDEDEMEMEQAPHEESAEMSPEELKMELLKMKAEIAQLKAGR